MNASCSHRRELVLATALIGLSAFTGCADASYPEPLVAYQNGMWWTSEGFELGSRMVAGGTFVDAPAGAVDSIVDLERRWIVPPFGDAHTHNLDGDTSAAPAYLREGVFYVQVLTNTIGGASRVRDAFEEPASIDVTYANAGISSEVGHPILAYEPRAMGLDWTAYDERREEICASRLMEGDAYFFIEDAAELDAIWPRILESEPDILKIYLLRSEDPVPTGCERMGLTGMRPELAKMVTERARAAGIPVWAHVETAYDVAVAADIGVSGLAHLPGYGWDQGDLERNRLDAAALERAGERRMVVTPTLQLLDNYGLDSTTLAAARTLQRDNLRAWQRAGGRVAIGSDWYGQTARPEVEAFAALGLWDNEQILRIWAQTTPQTIFPDRRLGSFEPGYEASWLVLTCDPVERLDCVDEITMRMKQGYELELPPEPEAAPESAFEAVREPDPGPGPEAAFEDDPDDDIGNGDA